MITLALLVVQMMCKGVMHLFWATGALHEPNKRASEAVSQRKKEKEKKQSVNSLKLYTFGKSLYITNSDILPDFLSLV